MRPRETENCWLSFFDPDKHRKACDKDEVFSIFYSISSDTCVKILIVDGGSAFLSTPSLHSIARICVILHERARLSLCLIISMFFTSIFMIVPIVQVVLNMRYRR